MLKGSFELIGDKSISHRAVMFSSISKGHNKISYENTMKLFKTYNRVCIEQATSTGKSYVIASVIASSKFKRVLLLAPSNFILNQFKENSSLSESV